MGEPGYITEHFIKEPEDIQKILSIPFEAPDVSRDEYDKLSAYLGDRGLVSFQIPHAAYQVHILTGSETLALMSFDCREPLLELTRVFAERIYNYVEKILDLGIQAPIAWVGPEVFIPPLMSPKDFQDFVYNFDKPICDLIHLRESYVWVHCHSKVANYLDSFIDMGVDVLNPLEPPKNGDIHLGDAVKKYGNRIGWEGNIEIQDILLASPDELRNLIDTCVDQGAPSGRFILCNSAGFDEYPVPTESYLDNLELYLRHGYEAVNRYSR